MTDITLGYSDSEDRVWLASSDGHRFWLTRRLLSRLLDALAGLLTRTVPGGDLPNALPADQRIHLEHAESLARSPEGQPALLLNKAGLASPSGVTPTPPRLATRITCQADGPRGALIVEAAGVATRFELNRIDFHRLLAAMATVANQAHWDLPDLPAWLDPTSVDTETRADGA
ncbi:MAG: hypothetical protein ACOZB0_10655 [Pseudomonadota bacterium]